MSKLDHTLKLMPQSQRELAKDEIKALVLGLLEESVDKAEGLQTINVAHFCERLEAL